jgi:hypothetical protein
MLLVERDFFRGSKVSSFFNNSFSWIYPSSIFLHRLLYHSTFCRIFSLSFCYQEQSHQFASTLTTREKNRKFCVLTKSLKYRIQYSCIIRLFYRYPPNKPLKFRIFLLRNEANYLSGSASDIFRIQWRLLELSADSTRKEPIALFPLIRHRLHRKQRLQQLFPAVGRLSPSSPSKVK